MTGATAISRGVRDLWLDLERGVLRGLERFGARFGPARHTAAHLRTGTRGEMEALFFLRKSGYTVIARRWRCTEERGDLDLVGWDGGVLCFVEVKTRSSRDIVPAEFAVDRDKQRMLRGMARAFERRMPRTPEPAPVRFDVVSVYLLGGRGGSRAECELIRDAFSEQARRAASWQ